MATLAIEAVPEVVEGAEAMAPEIEAEGQEAEQAIQAEYEEHARGLKDRESDP